MAQLAAEHSDSAVAATPAPLGLLALALTTFLVAFSNTGMTLGGNSKAIAGVVLFAGLLQLLAGLKDLKGGNILGGTVLATFGALALAAGFSGSWAIGNYGSLAVALITLLFFLSALKASRAWMLTLFLLFLTFAALALGAFGVSSLGTVGGYLGILAALAALYTAWAGLLDASNSSFHLPV